MNAAISTEVRYDYLQQSPILRAGWWRKRQKICYRLHIISKQNFINILQEIMSPAAPIREINPYSWESADPINEIIPYPWESADPINEIIPYPWESADPINEIIPYPWVFVHLPGPKCWLSRSCFVQAQLPSIPAWNGRKYRIICWGFFTFIKIFLLELMFMIRRFVTIPG